MPRPHDEEVAFVGKLYGLEQRDDGGARGKLAAMRRGLGKAPGAVGETLQAVFPLMQEALGDRMQHMSKDSEDAYLLIASLAAWHPMYWSYTGGERTSLGASFARLQRDEQGGESVERRFAALLNSHPDDLPSHLRQAIGLLKSRDVPVDYARLLRDAQEWGADSRLVQREWARDFWAGRRAEQEPAEAAAAVADE
jgi:CRISPR system Cascade subunit CasB